MRTIYSIALVAILPFAGVASAADELIVYTAKKIITMEPAAPEATAVAVQNGRIVAVGSLESMSPWLESRTSSIDRSLEDKILMPGFIEPHVHPSLPAVTTQFPYLAPDDWTLPTGDFPGATTPKDYEVALKALAAEHDNPEVPFIAWGYHRLWHGDVYKDTLNKWFPEQAVMLWHRSFHEIIGNDAAFELLGMSEADTEGHEKESDWSRGHFWENGLKAMLPKMPFLLAPERFGKGMQNFLEMAHSGGVTTALDMGTGVFGSPEAEINLIRATAEGTEAPTRIILTPIISDFLSRGKTPEQALEEIDSWRQGNTRRVMIDRHFKLMLDGAIFSGLSQMGPPGYIDGHQGQWMVPPEVSLQWARIFWNAGYKLHAHTNGDKSTQVFLDILRTLQNETPRVDHRFTLEHFAYSTEDQSRALKELGALVSANPYYHYILSDIYSEKWLGPDRGKQMVRLGSLARHQVPFTLHSDSPMAPLSPLTLAWTAVNRVTINGNLNAPEERISLDTAMRAITIDAAWVIGWENEIGSIRAGKKADFTILESDPYRVGAKRLKDVKVWGTVFEGEVYPVKR